MPLLFERDSPSLRSQSIPIQNMDHRGCRQLLRQLGQEQQGRQMACIVCRRHSPVGLDEKWSKGRLRGFYSCGKDRQKVRQKRRKKH